MVHLTFIYDRKGQSSSKKTAMVELRISMGKEKAYLSTGIKLLPKEWSKGSVVGRTDWKELNEQLEIIKRRCSEIVVQMMNEGRLEIKAIPSVFRNGMEQKKTFLEYARECAEVRNKDLADGTKKIHKRIFDFLGSWKGIVYFSDVTEQNVRKMDKYLADKGLKESSRYNYHKVVKCYIRMAFGDGLIKVNPYMKFKPKRGDSEEVRFLLPEQFHRFETCKIEDGHLARVRDVFIFQTYTMMGYSDLEEFDYKDCEKVKGQLVYKSKRKKTKQEFVVPMLPQALAILKKYNYKLPVISNERYNDYLKAAVKHAGIEEPVTTHWARHTGATMLLNEGKVPIHIVRRILGHASIRETEKTYAAVLDTSVVDTMIEYQQRSDPNRSAEVKKCSIVNLRVTHGKVK